MFVYMFGFIAVLERRAAGLWGQVFRRNLSRISVNLDLHRCYYI